MGNCHVEQFKKFEYKTKRLGVEPRDINNKPILTLAFFEPYYPWFVKTQELLKYGFEPELIPHGRRISHDHR